MWGSIVLSERHAGEVAGELSKFALQQTNTHLRSLRYRIRLSRVGAVERKQRREEQGKVFRGGGAGVRVGGSTIHQNVGIERFGFHISEKLFSVTADSVVGSRINPRQIASHLLHVFDDTMSPPPLVHYGSRPDNAQRGVHSLQRTFHGCGILHRVR